MTGHVDHSEPNSQEEMAALTALYEATIRKLRRTNKRKLSTLTRSFEGRLAEAYEKLNDSAQIVSRVQSMSDDLQRLVRNLKHEAKQREVLERQAIKDMQYLAAKVLTLHSKANTRLDPSTAAIFTRRGWNTEMSKS